MKRLGLAIIALLLSVTMIYAKSDEKKLSKEPFAINVQQLSRYLDLEPSQLDKVSEISEYFLEMQKQSLRLKAGKQEKKITQAVYGNLKLMKQTLTPEQYRKYLILLNVTNNNNREKGISTDYLVVLNR